MCHFDLIWFLWLAPVREFMCLNWQSGVRMSTEKIKYTENSIIFESRNWEVLEAYLSDAPSLLFELHNLTMCNSTTKPITYLAVSKQTRRIKSKLGKNK